MALDRSRWNLSVFALIVLTIWAYAPLRSAGWVFEDRRLDATAIHLAQFSLLPRVWTTLSMRLQAGDPVWTFHAVNVAVHCMNALLLSALLPMTYLGLTALTLFLLHPLNAEAVSYISARADLWMGMAVLLTLLAQRLRMPLARYGVTLLGLAGAVAAKETGVMALGLVAVWCLYTHRSFSKVFLLGVLSYGAWITFTFLQRIGTWTPHPPNTWHFLAMQSAAIWRLLALIVPIGFTPDHNWSAVPFALGLACFLALIACVLTAWQQRYLRPRVSFAVIFAAMALLPRLIVPTQIGLTEHHTYVAWMGLWLSPAIERTL